jgi:hypothetical protein
MSPMRRLDVTSAAARSAGLRVGVRARAVGSAIRQRAAAIARAHRQAGALAVDARSLTSAPCHSTDVLSYG